MTAPMTRFTIATPVLSATRTTGGSDYDMAYTDVVLASDCERLEQECEALKSASLMLGRNLADALKQVEAMRLDANLYRQWFNAVQDLSPQYLEQADYQAAARLLESLGLPTPSSVSAGAVQTQPEETPNAN